MDNNIFIILEYFFFLLHIQYMHAGAKIVLMFFYILLYTENNDLYNEYQQLGAITFFILQLYMYSYFLNH